MSPTNHPKEIFAATIKTLDTREVLMEDGMSEALVDDIDESLSRFSFESVNRDITIPSTANSYDDIPFVGDIQTEMEELGLLEWGDASRHEKPSEASGRKGARMKDGIAGEIRTALESMTVADVSLIKLATLLARAADRIEQLEAEKVGRLIEPMKLVAELETAGTIMTFTSGEIVALDEILANPSPFAERLAETMAAVESRRIAKEGA